MFNYTKKAVDRYNGQEINVPNIPKIVIHAILLIVVLVCLWGSFGTVDAGFKGVKTSFGAVTGEVPAGLYIKLPFVQQVQEVDTQTQKEQTDAEAASSDLQTVHTSVALNYNVYPDKVTELFSSVGLDYKSRLIDPAIQEAVKAVTAKYTAEQLITQRQQVQDEIKGKLVERLAPTFIQVTNLSIINFDFSPSFNKSIEAKVTAEQDALAAKNKLQQVQYEAEQTVSSAKAQAEAIQIQAQAIQQQGGANYVQLQAVNKWDGHLPNQMVPGSAVPFINLKN